MIRSTLASAVLVSTLLTAAGAQSPSLRLQTFSLIVRDYDEARTWYTQKLGFAVVRDQAFGAGERFIQIAPPGQSDIGIVLQKAVRAPDPREPQMATDYSDRIGTQVNIVLHSATVQAYADTLKARGVTLTSPVRVMPWGTQVTFVDLYGNSFVVVGPAK
jgi:catechol 2,3-dioxygenase-like lactoylglutathione lyase family enzyme